MVPSDIARAIELGARSWKLNIGFVDRTVVTVAERRRIYRVLTTERRDLAAIRGSTPPRGHSTRALESGRPYLMPSGVVAEKEVAMGKIEDLEQQVQALSLEELARFRTWFLEFDWAAWHQQIERDVQAGRLDNLADKALGDHASGKTQRI
jgi:hypothetical protein